WVCLCFYPDLSGGYPANIHYLWRGFYSVGLADGSECGHRQFGHVDDHGDGRRGIQLGDLVVGHRSAQRGDGKLQSDVDFWWSRQFDDDDGSRFFGGTWDLSHHGNRKWRGNDTHRYRQPDDYRIE